MSKGMILGLTGVAGAGKSTVADILVEHYGFTRVSFAGPLKKMLRTLNPVLQSGNGVTRRLSDIMDAYAWSEYRVKESSWGPEYRRLLQVLGTDCIRAVDDEFWVKAAMKEITAKGNYVFDDCRFPNEAAAVKRNLGHTAHVVRPDAVGAGTHVSELHAGHMGEDYELLNDGNTADLIVKVGRLMQVLDWAAA